MYSLPCKSPPSSIRPPADAVESVDLMAPSGRRIDRKAAGADAPKTRVSGSLRSPTRVSARQGALARPGGGFQTRFLPSGARAARVARHAARRRGFRIPVTPAALSYGQDRIQAGIEALRGSRTRSRHLCGGRNAKRPPGEAAVQDLDPEQLRKTRRARLRGPRTVHPAQREPLGERGQPPEPGPWHRSPPCGGPSPLPGRHRQASAPGSPAEARQGLFRSFPPDRPRKRLTASLTRLRRHS